MFIFIFLPVILYFVIGTIAAKSVYIYQSRNNPIITASTRAKKLNHGSACYQNPTSYYYSPRMNCDCNMLQKSQDILNKGDSPDVSNPYITLFAWPVIGFHHFLTAVPESKKVDYNKIEELERLNDIK